MRPTPPERRGARPKTVVSGGVEYTLSTGNVFADLGLPDAEELLAKADLTYELTRLIEDRGLTDAKAAKRLGLKTVDLRSLLRGRLRETTIEQLQGYIATLRTAG